MVQSRQGRQQPRTGVEVKKGALQSDLSVPLDVQHHNNPAYHTFGAALDIPITVSDSVAGAGQGSPGSSELVARADHTHGTKSGAVLLAALLSGNIPVAGNVTLGTLVIPSATYDRIAYISAMFLVSTGPATIYQLGYTAPDGQALFTRVNGGGPTGTLNSRGSLIPAGVSPTLTFSGALSTGAAVIGTVAADGRFNRVDVLLLPA